LGSSCAVSPHSVTYVCGIELPNCMICEVGSLFLLRMLWVGGHFSPGPGEWQYDNCQLLWIVQGVHSDFSILRFLKALLFLCLRIWICFFCSVCFCHESWSWECRNLCWSCSEHPAARYGRQNLKLVAACAHVRSWNTSIAWLHPVHAILRPRRCTPA